MLAALACGIGVGLGMAAWEQHAPETMTGRSAHAFAAVVLLAIAMAWLAGLRRGRMGAHAESSAVAVAEASSTVTVNVGTHPATPAAMPWHVEAVVVDVDGDLVQDVELEPGAPAVLELPEAQPGGGAPAGGSRSGRPAAARVQGHQAGEVTG